MRNALANTLIGRSLALASLLAYGTFGVFGHTLHGLLPCAHELAEGLVAAAQGDCCGDCCHDAALARQEHGPSSHGPQATAAGHDAHDCSLCALLAKLKVGQAALFTADVRAERCYSAPPCRGIVRPAELNLSAAPRGPPLA